MVWIEIFIVTDVRNGITSPPSRWCGLKYSRLRRLSIIEGVTTFAVVWIEIGSGKRKYGSAPVTTFAVVWIEISRKRWEKRSLLVTTFAVVWIEILQELGSLHSAFVTTFAVVWIEIHCRLQQ